MAKSSLRRLPSSGHAVNGTIALVSAASEVLVNANTKLSGAGAVDGGAGIVTLASGTTFTLDGVALEGTSLTVAPSSGTATMDNRGLVAATGASATLVFDANLVLADTGDGVANAQLTRWRVDNASTMQFNRPFNLAGDFAYNGSGVFDFTTASACHATTGGLYNGTTQQNSCPGDPPLHLTGGNGFHFVRSNGLPVNCGGCP